MSLLDNHNENNNNFYFQQRNNKLNIRKLSSINIENIIKNNDIDSLQDILENITFCQVTQQDLQYLTDPLIIKLFHLSQLMLEYLLYSQDQIVNQLNSYSKKYSKVKRELVSKRRELITLQESTNHLKSQIKLKKDNISTLETLLKEAAAKKAKKRYLQKLEIDDDEEVDDEIEYINKMKKSKAKKSKSKRNNNDSDADDELEDIPIMKDKRDPLVKNENEIDLKIVLEKHQIALSDIALEMRRGLELTIQSLQKQYDANMAQLLQQSTTKVNDVKPNVATQSPNDVDMFVYMTEKWNKLESSLRNQMEEQLLTYESKLKPKLQAKGSLTHGELENDTIDDNNSNNNTSKQLINQLQQFDSSISTLRVDVKDAAVAIADTQILLLQRSQEIAQLKEELRRSQQQQITTPIIISNKAVDSPKNIIIAKPQDPVLDEVIDKQIDKEIVKKVDIPSVNLLGSQLADEPVLLEDSTVPIETNQSNEDVIIDPIITDIHQDIKLDDDIIDTIPQLVEEPILDIPTIDSKTDDIITSDGKSFDNKEVEEKPIELITSSDIPLDRHTIVFTKSFNPDIEIYSRDDLLVHESPNYSNDAGVALDELVFDIRKSVAEQLSIPLARVALIYNGQVITLGMDIQSNPFTFEEAIRLVDNGQIQLKITSGKVVTDAQLDLLVQSWEKKNSALLQSSIDSDSPIKQKKWNQLVKSIGSSKEFVSLSNTESIDYDTDDDGFDDDIPDIALSSEPSIAIDSNIDVTKSVDVITTSKSNLKTTSEILRKSLEDELESVSEKEGLTDDELRQKMRSLQDITNKFPVKLSNKLSGSRDELISKAIADSGSDDLSDNKSKTLNVYLSQKFKTGLLKLNPSISYDPQSNPLTSNSPTNQSIYIRKRRNFDDDEDDVPLMASQSKPSIRSINQSKDTTSSINIDSKYISNNRMYNDTKLNDSVDRNFDAKSLDRFSNQSKAIDKEVVNTIKTPDSKSVSISNRYDDLDSFDNTLASHIDSNTPIKSDDKIVYNNKNEIKYIDNKLDNTIVTNDTSNYSDLQDSLNMTTDTNLGDTSDWNRTVDSNITLPSKEDYLRTSIIQRKANEYEQNALLNTTNDQIYTSSLSTDNKHSHSKNSSSSPFRGLYDDSFDSQNHSLALSDSAVVDELSMSSNLTGIK